MFFLPVSFCLPKRTWWFLLACHAFFQERGSWVLIFNLLLEKKAKGIMSMEKTVVFQRGTPGALGRGCLLKYFPHFYPLAPCRQWRTRVLWQSIKGRWRHLQWSSFNYENHISDKGLIPKMHEELRQLSSKKKKKFSIEMGRRFE